MARNHRGSTKRSDILAQTTVRQAGSSRQPGSEPYIDNASVRPIGGSVRGRIAAVLVPSGNELSEEPFITACDLRTVLGQQEGEQASLSGLSQCQ